MIGRECAGEEEGMVEVLGGIVELVVVIEGFANGVEDGVCGVGEAGGWAVEAQ